MLGGMDDPLVGRFLALMNAHPDALDRRCRPGHLTGSALVLDATGTETLLLLHTKLGRWLQPGGHADGDGNLARVALREATEETGIPGLRIHPTPVQLDIHRVAPPTEDAHLHYDVRFLVLAPADAQPQPNHESQALRWVPLDGLADMGCDPGLIALGAIAQAGEIPFPVIEDRPG